MAINGSALYLFSCFTNLIALKGVAIAPLGPSQSLAMLLVIHPEISAQRNEAGLQPYTTVN